jgi:hypothetical protein
LAGVLIQKRRRRVILSAFKGSGANYFFFLATFFLGAAFLTAFLTAFFLTAMIKSPPFENIYHTQGVGISCLSQSSDYD